ncbi:MAG: ABC transporter permease [Candidatus Limnocylindrales bacterium]|jgi:lipooligosaccharide transport system permease protein
MLALRTTVPLVLARPTRIVERNMLVYRHSFMVIFSGFFEPLFYLFSMGFGVGALIGDVPLGNGHTVPYAVFVAPALLASSSMNGAIYETSNNFFYKLKYAKLYDAIISTPMSIGDVARGEIMWALLRGSLYAIGFLVVIAVLGLAGFGLLSSPLGLLAFPAAMVVGFGFAGAGMAATTFVRQWRDFDYLQLAIMPMFLFSGTFYPIDAYPPALQAFVQATPLYRGVHLIRALTTGTPDATIAIDLVYLMAMGVIGLAITSRRLSRLLQS